MILKLLSLYYQELREKDNLLFRVMIKVFDLIISENLFVLIKENSKLSN